VISAPRSSRMAEIRSIDSYLMTCMPIFCPVLGLRELPYMVEYASGYLKRVDHGFLKYNQQTLRHISR